MEENAPFLSHIDENAADGLAGWTRNILRIVLSVRYKVIPVDKLKISIPKLYKNYLLRY